MDNGVDISGNMYNQLMVLEYSHRDKGNKVYYTCKCVCGKTKSIRKSYIVNGYTKSCGCINKRAKTHGMKGTKIYMVWNSLTQRCNNPNRQHFSSYGGRGISCEWTSFEQFYNDMGESYTDGLSIDRINNNGNYSKSNCRWTTIDVQANNRRSNRYVEYKGNQYSISQLSTLLGINKNTLKDRLNAGLDNGLLFKQGSIKGHTYKKVRMLKEDGMVEIFKNLSDAVQKTGVGYTTIRNQCTGKTKNNITFSYIQ